MSVSGLFWHLGLWWRFWKKNQVVTSPVELAQLWVSLKSVCHGPPTSKNVCQGSFLIFGVIINILKKVSSGNLSSWASSILAHGKSAPQAIPTRWFQADVQIFGQVVVLDDMVLLKIGNPAGWAQPPGLPVYMARNFFQIFSQFNYPFSYLIRNLYI